MKDSNAYKAMDFWYNDAREELDDNGIKITIEYIYLNILVLRIDRLVSCGLEEDFSLEITRDFKCL